MRPLNRITSKMLISTKGFFYRNMMINQCNFLKLKVCNLDLFYPIPCNVLTLKVFAGTK